MADLVLFGTEGCHLCEEAEQLLLQAGLSFDKQDIMANQQILQRYAIRIPVLLNKTNELELDWPFDAPRLQAFLT